MVAPTIARTANLRLIAHDLPRIPASFQQAQWIARSQRTRHFSSSPVRCRKQTEYKEPFGKRLRRALGETKIKWYPIPVGVGIGFLGLAQLYRINERESAKRREEELEDAGFLNMPGKGGEDGGGEGRPRRRERIRPSGPWFVYTNDTSRNIINL